MTTATLTLVPLDIDRDASHLHRWVTHPKARFWEMGDATLEDVVVAYRQIGADPHHDAFLGLAAGEPAFLMERYDPAHSELAEHGRWTTGHVGMHVLVAPSDEPVPGFTRAVFTAVMDFLFSDPAVERVVVEPDVRNDRIAALNAESGFVVHEHVQLSTKVAALSSCTRDQYYASPLGRSRA